MNEQVMVYVVSANANANATLLFSDDNNFFYWNSLRFENLNINDFVFIVNKTAGYVLFTKLDKKSIATEIDANNNLTRFTDNGKNFEVTGTEAGGTPWNEFIRLKIIDKLEITENWQWQPLGAGEITYLNGDRINIDTAQNRIRNIDQLKQLTTKSEILNILDKCRLNFAGGPPPPGPDPTPPPITNMNNIITAIKTKPFILLAGISGTGKSRLVRTLAYKTCHKEVLQKDPKKPGNFELIPVRPNWHDSSELMGYVSRINGEKYITTAFLKFIAKAWKHLDTPFFLCLDEMNLAPVEQYFAEYLSIIETRQNELGEIVTDYLLSKSIFENENLYNRIKIDLGLENDSKFNDGIGIPKNLIVMGTVNMDETTHSFSRKVLDRAMTFEMNDIDLKTGLDANKNDWKYPEGFIGADNIIGTLTAGSEVYEENQTLADKVIAFLEEINTYLEGTPFKIAYRVRDEFLIYCFHANQSQTNGNWFDSALDEMTTMKILSRIEGDEARTGNVLRGLQKILTPDYKKSNAKLREMETRLQNSGYTSFWS